MDNSKERKNNPNGANQWHPDPRQAEFLKNYLDKNSDTYANAYQSAIKAGYANEYAENITNLMPKWLSEALDEKEVTQLAEENLKNFLQDKEKRYRWKSTEFTLKTLKKEKYSERVEHTGKNGQPLTIILSPEIAQKYELTPDTEPDSEGQT